MTYLSTTMLAKENNIDRDALFIFLEKEGFVEKEKGAWNLTDKGLKVGKYCKNKDDQKWITWPQNISFLYNPGDKLNTKDQNRPKKPPKNKRKRVFPPIKMLENSFHEIDRHIMKLGSMFDSTLDPKFNIFINRRIRNCFKAGTQDMVIVHPDKGAMFVGIIADLTSKNISSLFGRLACTNK